MTFDDRLIKFLEEEVAKEKEMKKARYKGIVIDKRLTKKLNILLILKKNEYEIAVLVNKNKREIYEIAEKVKINDVIYIEGEKGIDIVWCDKLEVITGRKDKDRLLVDFC